jgi:alkanesulfonate monooxygenase SsuD/methylene tetrahydromethanopterin reductase-like flavin-dependent oxidoreductase (luciferase family)
MQRILFGANVPQIGNDYETVKRTVLECERYGFDFVWISDHLRDISSTKSYLECWTTLSALAAATERIRLCTILVNNLFRNPGLVAKMGATLDQISNGRLDFGIGAGWLEEECESNGIPFPKPSIRVQMLDEAIEIIRKLWTNDNVTFLGKHYSLKNASANPKPVQRPHPPIWTGIMYGGTRMLKLIAKQANVWTISSLYLPEPEKYSRIRNEVDRYCHKIGRDPEDIRSGIGVGCVIAEDERRVAEKVRKFQPLSVSVKGYSADQPRLEGTPHQCVEKLKTYVDAGVKCFVLAFPDIVTLEPVKLFAETVIPSLRG